MIRTTLRILQRFRSEYSLAHVISYMIAIPYALIIIIPLYYVFISSFKENAQIFGSPLSLPNSWDIANYIRAERDIQLFRAMKNSILIVSGSEILILLVGFPAAYAIARIPGRLSNLFESIFATGFLFPAFALILPIFLMAAAAGLLFNPICLVLFYVASRLPLTVIILASQMREIPFELEESATLDGANRLQIMYHIIFPLARSGFITVLVLNFIGLWNEYLFAFIMLGNETRTVQVALPYLKGRRIIDFGLVGAGVVISVLPVLIFFIVFQERIVKGLLGGGVKG